MDIYSNAANIVFMHLKYAHECIGTCILYSSGWVLFHAYRDRNTRQTHTHTHTHAHTRTHTHTYTPFSSQCLVTLDFIRHVARWVVAAANMCANMIHLPLIPRSKAMAYNAMYDNSLVVWAKQSLLLKVRSFWGKSLATVTTDFQINNSKLCLLSAIGAVIQTFVVARLTKYGQMQVCLPTVR